MVIDSSFADPACPAILARQFRSSSYNTPCGTVSYKYRHVIFVTAITQSGSRMNIPNQLTLARFVLTMVFIVLASLPRDITDNLLHCKIGFAIAFIAGFTDFLDGYLARKFNLITDFGKLMDPLADKIFTVSCFVVLVEFGAVPAWICIILLTREFAVTGLRTMGAGKGQVIAAGGLGKIKTLLQMLVLAVGGFIWIEWISLESTRVLNIAMSTIWDVLLGGVAIVTVYTGVDYYVKGRKLYMQEM
jgi:CDP-diacylglycerol--glycerol-3-phosphate 3-phosphatidyltransferase